MKVCGTKGSKVMGVHLADSHTLVIEMAPKIDDKNYSCLIMDDLGGMTVTREFEAAFNDPETWHKYRIAKNSTKARRKARRLLRTLAQQWLLFDHSGKARALLKKARNG